MLPDKISIKTIKKVEGKLEEVSKEYYYKFNFNAINAFRKDEGLDMASFSKAFDGLEKGEFDSFEAVCKLFFYALKEGCRIAQEDLDLSLEDVVSFLNEDAEKFTDIVGEFGNSQDNKKKEVKEVEKVKQ
tara:strand:- start:93 stop:482 length:390 start_codon:yes stop_codon:yes gene_type:complete